MALISIQGGNFCSRFSLGSYFKVLRSRIPRHVWSSWLFEDVFSSLAPSIIFLAAVRCDRFPLVNFLSQLIVRKLGSLEFIYLMWVVAPALDSKARCPRFNPRWHHVLTYILHCQVTKNLFTGCLYNTSIMSRALQRLVLLKSTLHKITRRCIY